MAQAAQAGRSMVRQVLSTSMPWGDSHLNEYVNRVGQNVVRGSGSEQAFTFFVVYNPEVNAQAFPGGYVVVNSGVISLAESEGELASVLSHEIAHVNACHWRGLSWKTNLFELLVFVPAVAFTGPVGLAITSGGAMVAPAARARFNRSAESEADRLAISYLGQSGYDPQAAVRMFERMEQEEERRGPPPGGVLASHPRVAERRERLEKLLLNLPPPSFSPHDDAEFLQLREQVREYDRIYARAVGVAVPGYDPPPPELAHRPPTNTAP
jgi:predicted Zn-dependent protease